MRHIVFPRESYVPVAHRDTPPFVPEGTDLAVYQYELMSTGPPTCRAVAPGPARTVYGAVVFAGKAQKPLWNYTFRSNEQRQAEIARTVVARRAHLAHVAEQAKERREYMHPYKVGDVFTASWGYDQTNVNAYEVTEVHGKALVLREIGLHSVDGSHVVPMPGHYCGDPVRVIVRGPSVKVEDHYAHPWKGSPCYTTPEGYGH